MMIHQKSKTFEESGNVLSLINSFSTLFLVFKASSTDDEDRIFDMVSLLMKDFPVARHRFLFYQTDVGKIAIVRQLKSQLHVDFDAVICRQILPHIKTVVHIDENKGALLPGVQSLNTIENVQNLANIIIVS